MESTTQKILMPTSGICNLTPDKVCEDTELQDCTNITFADDALRVIRPPVTKIQQTTSATLAYVHLTNDASSRYIYTQDTSFYYDTSDNTIDAGAVITSVTAIGNMLILNTTQGLRYYLWKAIGYKYMGDRLPVPDLSLRMSSVVHTNNVTDMHYKISTHEYMRPWTGSDTNIDENNKLNIPASSESDHKAFEDLIIGMYAEVKSKAAEKNWFTRPFMARYALELYDGSYACISNPVMLLPAMNNNHFFSLSSLSLSYTQVRAFYHLYINILPRELQYSLVNGSDFSGWKDIVKKIVIFSSPEVEIYNLDELSYEEEKVVANKTVYTYDLSNPPVVDSIVDNHHYELQHSGTFSLFRNRKSSDVIKELTSTGLFYKIAEVEFTSTDGYEPVTMEKDTIKDLASQSILSNDDFFSFCPLFPNDMHTFNRRLHLTGVRRGFFEGFRHFSDLHGMRPSQHYYTVSVIIDTDEGEKTVTHSFQTQELFFSDMWFYYPDPRAIEVMIKANNDLIMRKPLKEHPRLNGAYYASDTFPPVLTAVPAGTGTYIVSAPEPETLPNYILQSEVDNPFTFLSSGYVRVGQGTIIGMAALTTALSQDAYKVATTLAFTTQGIWALTNDSTGKYAAVAPPFSREVCNNPQSITMADNTVFFTSEKGLMMITDDGIRNVSHQLSGKNQPGVPTPSGSLTPFRQFIKTCRLAYDYTNSQLWLIQPGSNIGYQWVYNIRSATLSRFISSNQYKAIVSDYPDTLLQLADGSVLSMQQRPDINDDTQRYNASFITRPIKFGESIRMKSLREFLHIHDLSEGAQLDVAIYTSNDCKEWHQLPSLYGTGAKFFTFKYEFKNLKAIDTFSGTLIGYTPRQTNKIR